MSRPPIDPATGRRRAGRPPRIDVDRIAEAALAEIDGLSVAAVARRLEVSQGALYHHVDGLSDLVRLAADRSLADLPPLPEDRTGALALDDLVVALLVRMRDNPGLDHALLNLTSAPPRLEVVMGDVMARLVAEGAEPQAALDAVAIVTQIAHTLERQRRMVDADPAEMETVLRRRIGIVLAGTWRIATS